MTETDEIPRNEPAGKEAEEVTREARQWAMFCHLAGLAWMTWMLPVIGGVVAVLVLWQIKKDDHPFIDENGKRAINFQISMLIYFCAAAPLCLVIVGCVLTPVIIILNVIFTIIAAVRAGDGKYYKYPLSIEFIK